MDTKYSAYPLITIDPYTNLWAFSSELTGDYTRHWTGDRQSLFGTVTVDGKRERFAGKIQNDGVSNFEPDAMTQKSVKVSPLSTTYEMENDKITMQVKFTTPFIPGELKMMSRPISYISYKIASKDGKKHDVSILIGASSEIATRTLDQKIRAGIKKGMDFNDCFCGSDKNVLEKSGDHIRIDWGYLHIFSRNHHPLILKQAEIVEYSGSGADYDRYKYYDYRKGIMGEFAPQDGFASVCAAKSFVVDSSPYEDFVCIGYDDIHSIEYFGEQIDAYYKKDGETFQDAMRSAIRDYDEIMKRCGEFDERLIKDAEKISPDYAKVLSVAYRQVCGAHKLTYSGGKIQYFSKECFSNGCIGTVDVTYPSIPMFLKYCPDLVEGMLNPIFYYSQNEWKYPFAPHDVGQYPQANGQVYGMYNEDVSILMPVEECGNMLICTAALCRVRGSFDYFTEHKETLRMWADYLVSVGYDPDNQLCTDDFAGHLAHNCNLSLKAVIGIACFGDLLERSGIGGGDEYIKTAKKFAEKWEKEALEKDHFRLAFDKENTWSLKYNLIWDKLLGLNIFSKNVYDTEVGYYKTKMNEYGVPLDSRADYTKSDWLMWTAFLTDDEEYRSAVIKSYLKFFKDCKEQMPFSDWYMTSEPKIRGFRNRTVQGGLFIGLLSSGDFE